MESRDALRRLLAARALVDEAALVPEMPLGPGGLGLDSVSLLELLLEAERLCGRDLVDDFLRRGAMTVGALESAVLAGERQR